MVESEILKSRGMTYAEAVLAARRDPDKSTMHRASASNLQTIAQQRPVAVTMRTQLIVVVMEQA
jgi:hypothetical protein